MASIQRKHSKIADRVALPAGGHYRSDADFAECWVIVTVPFSAQNFAADLEAVL